MAAITQSESSDKRPGTGRPRRRSSVRIDMTPMVDLAFLLLTLFVLTRSLHESRVIKITMPEQSPDPVPMQEKRVITLLLGKDNNLYWYPGATPALNTVGFQGLRKLPLTKKAAIPDLVVLVKASDRSHYQNMIDVLDEFSITGINNYFITDITAEDNGLLAARE